MGWPRFLHDFPKIPERGLGLTDPSIWGKTRLRIPQCWHIYTHPDSGPDMCPKIGYFEPRLWANMSATWGGGGFVSPSKRVREDSVASRKTLYFLPPQEESGSDRFGPVKHCILASAERAMADSIGVRKNIVSPCLIKASYGRCDLGARNIAFAHLLKTS